MPRSRAPTSNVSIGFFARPAAMERVHVSSVPGPRAVQTRGRRRESVLRRSGARCGGRGAREEGQGHAREREAAACPRRDDVGADGSSSGSRSMPARASSPARPIATLRCAIGGRWTQRSLRRWSPSLANSADVERLRASTLELAVAIEPSSRYCAVHRRRWKTRRAGPDSRGSSPRSWRFARAWRRRRA